MRPTPGYPALVFIAALGIAAVASCVNPFKFDKSPQSGAGGQPPATAGSGGAVTAGTGEIRAQVVPRAAAAQLWELAAPSEPAAPHSAPAER